MIIYGTNGTHVRTEPLPGVVCPACATPDQMQGRVFSRYVHVYWVPLLPYTKPAVAVCQHCQHAWEHNELPAEATALKQALHQQKKSVRAPWWHWSGAVLLALGIGWAVDASAQDKRNDAAFLAAPRPGDVYTVRDDSTRNYTLYKVVDTHANTVDLAVNRYETDNSLPYGKLNQPDYYDSTTFTLTQLDLNIMHNKGVLTEVDRPEN